MALETIIYTRDTKQDGSVVVKSTGGTPKQAILKYLRDLKAMGYPMRNTTTALLRELIMFKLEQDAASLRKIKYGEENGT